MRVIYAEANENRGHMGSFLPFSDYLKQRIREDRIDQSDKATGLTPKDIGMHSNSDGPMDRDNEVTLSRLYQVAKVACREETDMTYKMLSQIATKNDRVRSALAPLRDDMEREGGKALKDKGLGSMRGDVDEVEPSQIDMPAGGAGGPEQGHE